MQPEDYGAQGIRDVHESIRLVRQETNPDLAILGYLVTMWNAPSGDPQDVRREPEEPIRVEVFEARIPHAAEYPEAIAYRKPIAMYKPKGAAARAVQALADEILARLAASMHVGEAA